MSMDFIKMVFAEKDINDEITQKKLELPADCVVVNLWFSEDIFML